MLELIKEKLIKFASIGLLTNEELDVVIKKLDYKPEPAPSSTTAFYLWDDNIHEWDTLEILVLEWMKENGETDVIVKRIGNGQLSNVKLYKDINDVDVDLHENEWTSDDEYTLTFPDGSEEPFGDTDDIEEAIKAYMMDNPECDLDDFEVELVRKIDVSINIHGKPELKMEFI